MYPKVISFFTYVFLAALTLFLLFAIGVSSANAQYHGSTESDSGDSFHIIFSDEGAAMAWIITPQEYELEYDGLEVTQHADGDFSLDFERNGKRFAYFNYLGANTYWFTYGTEKLHIKFEAY